MKKRIVIALVVVLALAATGSVAWAGGPWYVDDDNCPGPGSGTSGDPFCKIQDAVDAASSGDSILIAAGTYFENVQIIEKTLTLRGGYSASDWQPGGGETVVDGGGVDRVFLIHGSNIIHWGNDSVLENLTITNGRPTQPATHENLCGGGGVFVAWGHVTIRWSVITTNYSGPVPTCEAGAGGGIGVDGGGLTLEDSILADNHVTGSEGFGGFGGALSVVGLGYPAGSVFANLTNVLVTGNTADLTAVDLSQADLTMQNSTIAGNSAPAAAVGAFNNIEGDTVSIRNSIVWGNGGGSIQPPMDLNGSLDVTYSDIQGGWDGTGNIDADPLFVDPAGGDYHLHRCSPCIDAGTEVGAPDHDFEGDPRPQDDGYDMGADEGEVDVCAPSVTMTEALPNPAPVDTWIFLTANVDDSTTGSCVIVSAEYNIDGGDWLEMRAWDSKFDEVSEKVKRYIPPFPEAGVHEVCVRGTDVRGNVGGPECILLAVYDPAAGFVTGGGWIWSPPGAYHNDSTLAGKAIFGFVSKYKKGATTPTGQTEFQFRVADLNFHSDTYDWLVIAGARAQYKGSGTINGAGDYGFMLTAIDAELTPSTEVDKFRIKIWDKTTDEVVYDNQPGDDDGAVLTTQIGGGSIVIHKK